MGRLATAFFALLFARFLNVTSRIPNDLQPRLERLLGRDLATHMPARVIASSRLSYLFAVDPDWTQHTLIPCFDWNPDEQEAIAAWQGFGWQARIDEKLWPVLQPHFMGIFEHNRLDALGDSARTLVQLLVLRCIDLEPNQLSVAWTRNALRAMTSGLRVEALSWITEFLAQPEEPGEKSTKRGSARSADAIWAERIGP